MWNACRGDKASKETNSKLEAKKAMQAYQDAYYEGVSVHCGHTRLGPRRQRLTRVEWKAQKAHAERVASAESAVLDAATQREKGCSDAGQSECAGRRAASKREA